LILAGGRSSRFGSDKAAARIGGRSLLDLALTGLRASCRMVATSAPAGSVAASLAADLGLAVLTDRAGDPPGPLAGIRAGLDWAGTQGMQRLAVRPVDTPFLADDIFERLGDAMADAPAAYCVSPDGPQPLCALWTLRPLTDLNAILAGQDHPPVYRWLDDIGAVRLHVEQAAMFANFNTPAEFARLQKN
jgi:molybdopterin-guanine dinucleotide biosynthesis protein A